MSEDAKNADRIFKRLANSYPLSYALLRQIAVNFTKIYTEVNPEPVKKGETKYLDVGIGLDENGIPSLLMGENATIFFTALVFTIEERLQQIRHPDKSFADMEHEFVLKNKVCPNPTCGEVNSISDESCFKCGTKL
jgi:hypothetical protein